MKKVFALFMMLVVAIMFVGCYEKPKNNHTKLDPTPDIIYEDAIYEDIIYFDDNVAYWD